MCTVQEAHDFCESGQGASISEWRTIKSGDPDWQSSCAPMIAAAEAGEALDSGVLCPNGHEISHHSVIECGGAFGYKYDDDGVTPCHEVFTVAFLDIYLVDANLAAAVDTT